MSFTIPPKSTSNAQLTTSADIPKMLSEQDAMRIIAEHAPSQKKLEEDRTRLDERIEQGKQLVNRLMKAAQEKFNVDSPEKVLEILEQNKIQNANNARAYLIEKEAYEASFAEVKRASSLS